MSSTREKPATIADVAARAGVSIATVSRALRGFDNVAPATAELVIAAAQELSYTSNSHASMLRSGKSRSVSLVVPSLEDWYHAEVMAGAEAVFSDVGYDTLVSVAPNEHEFQAVVAAARPVRSRADGLIIVEQHIRDVHVRKLDEWQFPTTTVGQFVDGLSGAAIDDHEVGRIAAEHLIGLGHTRIGMIKGLGHRHDDTAASGLRRDGFIETMHLHGLETSPELEVAGPYTIHGGRQSVAALFAQLRPPTAVFCMSDLIAVGAMQTLRDVGLDVPKDVSVIGVDDHQIAKLLGLTTVRQPVGEMGAEAARILLNHFDDDDLSIRHVEFPCELVTRTTTGPAQR